MAGFPSISASQAGKTPTADIVEIGLLLPQSRVHALIELSKKRDQSVGQLLRGLIERALQDGEFAESPRHVLDPFGRN
jgi:hypothetical protein